MMSFRVRLCETSGCSAKPLVALRNLWFRSSILSPLAISSVIKRQVPCFSLSRKYIH